MCAVAVFTPLFLARLGASHPLSPLHGRVKPLDNRIPDEGWVKLNGVLMPLTSLTMLIGAVAAYQAYTLPNDANALYDVVGSNELPPTCRTHVRVAYSGSRATVLLCREGGPKFAVIQAPENLTLVHVDVGPRRMTMAEYLRWGMTGPPRGN